MTTAVPAKPSVFVRLAEWLRRTLGPYWAVVEDGWHVLRLARVAIAVAGLGSVLFYFLDQSSDILARLHGDKIRAEGPFFVALVLWSLTLWYWTRVAVSFNLGQRRNQQGASVLPGVVPFLIEHAPRVVAMLPFLFLALAVWREPGMMVETVTAAVVVAAIVWGRRPLLRKVNRRLFGGRIGWLDLPPPTQRQGPSAVRTGLLVAMVVVNIALFLWACADPVGLAWWLGAPWTVVLVALGGLTTILTALLLLSAEGRFPLLGLLLFLAVLFSPVNDNHAVRHLDGTAAVRPSIVDAAKTWRGQFPDDSSPRLILVATAGGASRAAFWTSTLLGRLRDQYPGFARHVFAISGVSGGSVGATFFRGLLESGCARPGPAGSQLATCVRALAEGDFLGPTLVGMLYPDLAQKLMPVPDVFPDRAKALEASWERHWRNTIGDDRLCRPFNTLSTPPALESGWLPALLLNGTDVASGERLVTSTLAWTSPDMPAYVQDLLGRSDRTLRLSTAAHNSARFPVISPAGRIDPPGPAGAPSMPMRVVDGGYYENNGAATALDLLNFLQKQSLQGVRFTVIQITSDPDAGQPPRPDDSGFVDDIGKPIQALLATRGARGNETAAMLKRRVQDLGGDYLLLDLSKDAGALGAREYPLNWILSKDSLDRMETQADRCLGEKLKGTIHEIMESAVYTRAEGPLTVSCSN